MSEKELFARCSICKERQYDTPDGTSCPNGHDDAESVFTLEPMNVCLDKNCITHDEWYAKCNELEATKQKLLAEQLHIKELREALEYFVDHSYEHGVEGGDIVLATCESREIAVKALAKQPDTRALDKALLEAEIKVLEEFDDKKYVDDKAHMIAELKAKLAELNKE